MPYFVDIEHDRKRVTIVGRDPVGLSDVIALLDGQVRDGAWSYGSLHDARVVTWIPSPDDVVASAVHIAAIVAAHGPRGPVGLVAASQTRSGSARTQPSSAEAS